MNTSGLLFLRDVRAMPRTDRVRHQIGVVAHRKVISFSHHHLVRAGKQLFPPRLESQRVIPFTEDGQQRKTLEWSCEGGCRLLVNRLGGARVAQVLMKGSKATASDSSQKRGAAFLVEVTADPEVAGCNPGENAGQCIELSYRRASHQREHAAEHSARRLPPECVY